MGPDSLLEGAAWLAAKGWAVVKAIATAAASLVTVLSTVAVALFTFLTWRVYRQIKGVMRESFESEFRPVLHAEATVYPARDRPQQWNAHFKLKNVGTGVAQRVRLRDRSAVDDRPAEWTDPETLIGDVLPDEEVTTPILTLDDHVVRVDIGYHDLYGNQFVTELRDKVLRYRRVQRTSDPDGDRLPERGE